MARKSIVAKAIPLLVLMAAMACGQDPAFNDLDRNKEATASKGKSVRSTDDASGEEQADDFGEGEGVIGDVVGSGPKDSGAYDDDSSDAQANNGSGGSGSSGGSGGGSIPGIRPEDYRFPNVTPDEESALKRCVAKWGSIPFSPTVTNVKKLVGVTVGGYGLPVNDTQVTSTPQMVLIVAGVNVGGATTYNLQNPNAYYCMMVNVNVETNLTINLHCNARLSDSLIGVNVGSTLTGDTARIGVHVNSKVTINTTRPNGDECVR